MSQNFINPYLQTSVADPLVTGKYKRVTGDERRRGGGWNWVWSNPIEGTVSASDLGLSVPSYRHTGYNQSIMDALTNVFTGSGRFGSDILLGDPSLEQDFIGTIDPKYYDSKRYGEERVAPIDFQEGSLQFGWGDEGAPTLLQMTNPYEAQSIADTLNAIKNQELIASGQATLGEDALIRAGEINPLDVEQVEETETKVYDPLVKEATKKAISKKAKTRPLNTGFAGSYIAQNLAEEARRMFIDPILKAKSNIEKTRAKKMGALIDQILGWSEKI